MPSIGKLLLKGATIVDTRSGRLTPDTSILCAEGAIVDIGPSGRVKSDSSARVVDATGKYAVPGFIDMHVHAVEMENAREIMILLLAKGVTGFRQMAGSPGLLRQWKAGAFTSSLDEAGLLSMPGDLLTPLNAYKPGDAVARVREQKEQGADYIKVGLVTPEALLAILAEAKRCDLLVAGHVPAGMDIAAASRAGFHSVEHLGPGDGVLISCSTEEEALRAESPPIPPLLASPLMRLGFIKKLGLGIIKRTIINPDAGSIKNSPERVRRIVESYNQDKARRLAAELVANGTWQVPTLIRKRSSQLAFLPEFAENPNLRFVVPSVLRLWGKITRDFERSLSPETKDMVLRLYEREMELVRLFDTEGVKMLAGSDAEGAGWLIAGFSLHQEFDELERAGISPLHVLQMITLKGAEYLGRTASMGSVETGKVADIVLLDANPIESVQNLHKIDAVIHAGAYHGRDELASLMEKVAPKAGEGTRDSGARLA